jgi:hypothetical protein
MARGNEIWIRVAGGGGTTYWINPPSLNVNWIEVDGPPGHQENIGEQGSLWWYDWPTGVVSRQEVAGGHIQRIPVTRSRLADREPCLTSMVEGIASIWVTVAPSNRSTCSR